MKAKQINKYVFCLCIGFLLGCWFGYAQEKKLPEPPLPSLADIQRRVGVKPDGRYGPITQKAWDEAYCNQAAIETFKKYQAMK